MIPFVPASAAIWVQSVFWWGERCSPSGVLRIVPGHPRKVFHSCPLDDGRVFNVTVAFYLWALADRQHSQVPPHTHNRQAGRAPHITSHTESDSGVLLGSRGSVRTQIITQILQKGKIEPVLTNQTSTNAFWPLTLKKKKKMPINIQFQQTHNRSC